MFNYCVWYILKNKYNSIIKRNALLFGTQAFPAHITIKSDLTLNEAKLVANRYKMLRPEFVPYGKAIQTHTKICMGLKLRDFYAIQQPLKVNGFETNIHVSLAYNNKPFSEMDIAVASIDIPLSINDFEVCIADCRTEPKSWSVIKI